MELLKIAKYNILTQLFRHFAGIRVYFGPNDHQYSPEFHGTGEELLPFNGNRYIEKVEIKDAVMIDYICVYTNDRGYFKKDFSGGGGEERSPEHLGRLVAVKGCCVYDTKSHVKATKRLQFMWEKVDDLDCGLDKTTKYNGVDGAEERLISNESKV